MLGSCEKVKKKQMNQQGCIWFEPLVSPVDSSHMMFALLTSAAVHGNMKDKCKDKRSMNSNHPKETTLASPKQSKLCANAELHCSVPEFYISTPHQLIKRGKDKERLFSIDYNCLERSHNLVHFLHILLAPNSRCP